MSSGGEEASDGFSPLSTRDFAEGDFTGPRKGQIRRGAYEEGDTLPRTSVFDLLAPVKRFSCVVSANVEQYEIVHEGLPEESRPVEVLHRMHLNPMTSEDASAHLARSLAAVDQKNSPVRKII